MRIVLFFLLLFPFAVSAQSAKDSSQFFKFSEYRGVLLHPLHPSDKVEAYVVSSMESVKDPKHPFLMGLSLYPKNGWLVSKETIGNQDFLWPIQFGPEGFSDLTLPFYGTGTDVQVDVNVRLCKTDGECVTEHLTFPSYYVTVGQQRRNGLYPYLHRMLLRHPGERGFTVKIFKAEGKDRLLSLHLRTKHDTSRFAVVYDGYKTYFPLRIPLSKKEWILRTPLDLPLLGPRVFVLADQLRGVQFLAHPAGAISDIRIERPMFFVYKFFIFLFFMLSFSLGFAYFKECGDVRIFRKVGFGWLLLYLFFLSFKAYVCFVDPKGAAVFSFDAVRGKRAYVTSADASYFWGRVKLHQAALFFDVPVFYEADVFFDRYGLSGALDAMIYPDGRAEVLGFK